MILGYIMLLYIIGCLVPLDMVIQLFEEFAPFARSRFRVGSNSTPIFLCSPTKWYDPPSSDILMYDIVSHGTTRLEAH